MTSTPLSRRQLVGLVVLTLMWGVNWPIMKLSLRELGPLHFRAVTMALGALALALFFRARGVRMLPRGTAEWRDVAVLGLPNILGWHGLSIIGLTQLPAGRAAILGFTMPVWTVLLGVLFYREQLTGRLVLAVVAVLAGITLLLWDELAQLAGQPAGIVWMQGAAFAWSLGTTWMQRAPKRAAAGRRSTTRASPACSAAPESGWRATRSSPAASAAPRACGSRASARACPDSW